MKVVVTGGTGLVGAECIRLALKHPQISEVVALARRPVHIPETASSEADKAKFKSVVVEDFGKEYSEDVKAELKGCDACIWNIAVTPSKAKKDPVEEVRKICQDYTMVGIKSVASVANPDHPFRFMYTSGAMSERDQNRSLWLIGDYRRMRGEVENQLRTHVSESGGKVEVQITKPGLIDNPTRGMVSRTLMHSSGLLPLVDVSEVAAAELDQATKGFEKDVLENEDLVRIGRAALQSLS